MGRAGSGGEGGDGGGERGGSGVAKAGGGLRVSCAALRTGEQLWLLVVVVIVYRTAGRFVCVCAQIYEQLKTQESQGVQKQGRNHREGRTDAGVADGIVIVRAGWYNTENHEKGSNHIKSRAPGIRLAVDSNSGQSGAGAD